MKFFYLQKSDRIVMTVLLCVIVAALVVITVTDGRQEDDQQALTPAAKPEKARHRANSGGYNRKDYRQSGNMKVELSYFDPNSADSIHLLRLGLQPWQVGNIMKYRRAGGVFRKPRDFAKLYGLTARQYEQLEPYISIEQEPMAAENYFYNYEPIEERDTLRYPIKIQPEDRVHLNHADTLQLRKVPGIGSHFARKIVSYRERLGGYCRVQQLLEIPDFPETALNFFVIPDEDTTSFRRLNVNLLSLNELKRHPYINFYMARAIVDFRRLHGPIKSLQQLSLNRDFTPETIERLQPYVEY